MPEIQLSRGLSAVVDERDVALVSGFKWHADNCANSRKPKRGATCRFKGVSRQRWGSWRVQFKSRYAGSFPTALLAAIAYDDLALIHFKEFARLNFPERAKQKGAGT